MSLKQHLAHSETTINEALNGKVLGLQKLIGTMNPAKYKLNKEKIEEIQKVGVESLLLKNISTAPSNTFLSSAVGRYHPLPKCDPMPCAVAR